MTAVLAIDQGTSSTKAVVVDGDGVVCAVVEEPVRPTYRESAVEQDPHELLASVLTAGRRALDEANVPVDVVALANQGESVLAWDPDSGAALTPILVWQDGRASQICAELKPHEDEIVARSGLALDPYFSAPKQAWIRRHLTSEGVVTTTDSWLVHQLTGELVTDVTTASRSLVFDLDRAEWDPRLLELFGLADETLPRIVVNDEIIGETTAFGPSLPLGGLVVDQQAALIAQRCLAPGEAKCTFGTGAFLLTNAGNEPTRSAGGLSTSVAWRLGSSAPWYCTDAQVYAAASAVRWLEDIGLIGSVTDLDELADVDAGTVVCVPAFAGLGAPRWRPTATATLSGMTLSTTPGQIVRAVLEGIAAQVAEMGEPGQTLRADGGLTRSGVLLQVVADVTQRPIEVYPSPHATALGTAALGRMSATPGLAIEHAVLPWQPARTFEPGWSASQADDFLARWRRLADADLP